MFWFLVAAQPSFADDREKILGIWRLVSFEVEFQATGEREHIRGKNPTGFIIFTAEGRMMVVLTNEGRKAPKTDQDRADPLNSMVAHTGMYRIEGDKWITKVDVSGNPALVGTEQARFFRVGWRPAPRDNAMDAPTRKGDGAHGYHVGTGEIENDYKDSIKN